MTAPAGSCALALAPAGTESAMARDAIMRWENEGGALLQTGSPALERRHAMAPHAKTEALEPLRSPFRLAPVNGPKRDVRRQPDAPAA